MPCCQAYPYDSGTLSLRGMFNARNLTLHRRDQDRVLATKSAAVSALTVVVRPAWRASSLLRIASFVPAPCCGRRVLHVVACMAAREKAPPPVRRPPSNAVCGPRAVPPPPRRHLHHHPDPLEAAHGGLTVQLRPASDGRRPRHHRIRERLFRSGQRPQVRPTGHGGPPRRPPLRRPRSARRARGGPPRSGQLDGVHV